MFFSSCNNYGISDQGFDLKELSGYVAFNADGTKAVLDPIDVAEDDGTASFNIEIPTGSYSDVTVKFTFGGTAVFGTDFNVANSTSAGGEIIIKHAPTDFQDFDNVDLDIEILLDGVVDGDKTLVITLESAIGADGTEFAVGRGGTDYLKSAEVNISDID